MFLNGVAYGAMLNGKWKPNLFKIRYIGRALCGKMVHEDDAITVKVMQCTSILKCG